MKISDNWTADRQLRNLFAFNPCANLEMWRVFTYMLIHSPGFFHIGGNLLVQIIFASPLESFHSWKRLIIVYLAGVIAGALGHSMWTKSTKLLVGASAGVFALLTANIVYMLLVINLFDSYYRNIYCM
jgi:rhomboid-related protein 1/2/3